MHRCYTAAHRSGSGNEPFPRFSAQVGSGSDGRARLKAASGVELGVVRSVEAAQETAFLEVLLGG